MFIKTLLHTLYGMFKIDLRQLMALFMAILATEASLANPVIDPNINPQGASVTQTQTTTTVNQSSQQAILNWHSFNIGSGEHTHFQQPTSGIALNRINPNQGVSQIFGSLTATGKIVLINQAGIHFGTGSSVNVGGLIASTADMSDQNFLAGKFIFDRPSAYSGASIINQGTIVAAQHGLVALMGNNVRNDGTIVANLGNVVLASGNKFTVNLSGDDLISFAIDEAASSTGSAVKHTGAIYADGGKIIMTAKSAAGVVDNVINMEGIAQANSVSQRNGEIIFSAEGGGTVRVAGHVKASGYASGTKGGKVHITGKRVLVDNGAKIDVSGDIGGGEILIGGDYQGKGSLPNATASVVMPETELLANALSSGDGGKIIVWADDVTRVYGKISARGGSISGNGGFVETSGKQFLDVAGIKVDTSASNGNFGTWLLDPTDLTISASATSNVASSGSPTSLFTGDSNSTTSTLNVTDLTNALALSNVTVQTNAGGSGSGSGDILVNTAISWNSGFGLTLSAFRNITSSANITNTGGGSVNLRADNTGTGTGTVSFTGGTNVTLSGGSGTVKVYYNPTVFGVPDVIYVGGTTPTAYMLVQSATNLQNMSTNITGNYALAKNLDVSSIANFVPVGTSGTPFLGSFDGQNFTISNLTITTTTLNSGIGLFGVVGNGSYTGSIANVGVVNPTISATTNGTNGAGIGAVVGRIQSSSASNVVLSNVYTSGGSIAGSTGGNHMMGGVVGVLTTGTMSNSYNSGTSVNITGGYIGGLAGHVNSGVVTGSYNTGTVSISATSESVGGLIGSMFGTAPRLLNSYNTGLINTSNGNTGNFSLTGGLIGTLGWNFTGLTLTPSAVLSTISDSFNAGYISGTSSNATAAGLIGQIDATTNPVIIQNVANLAGISMTGTNNTLGGLIGNINSGTINISSSFSAGNVGSGTTVGGVVGSNANVGSSTFSNIYWDTSTSTATNPASGTASITGVTGRTTSQMMAQATFSGFNFSGNWGIIENTSYPYLSQLYTSTPRVISGTSSAGSNQALSLASNGAALSGALSLAAVRTGASGFFYFIEGNNVIADNNYFVGYLTGTTKGNFVGQAAGSGASVTGLTLSANTINVGGSNNPTISNTNLGSAKGALSTTNILYSVSGANLTLGNATNTTAHLTTAAGTTYSIDGTIAPTGGGSGNLTFNGPVNISGTSITSSGTQTYGNTVALSSTPTFDAGNNAITFSGIISGSGFGITKAGAGTMTLNAANTYTGTTTINAGILRAGASNVIADGSGLTLAGGTFDLNGNSDTVGTLQGTSAITLGSGTLTVTQGSDQTYSGVMSGTNGNFVKAGSSMLTLSGANSYTGTTTINAGTLLANNNLALGTTAGGTTIGASGTLQIADTIAIGNEAINLAGTLTGLGTSSLAGAVTLTGAGTVGTSTSSDVFTLSGAVNGAFGLVVQGAGTTTFTGILGGVTPLASLTSNAGTTAINGTAITTSGSQTYNNAVTLGAANTTLTTDTGDITFNGTVNGGGNNLSLTGGTGNNAFALANTLTLNNLTVDGAAGSNSLTVNNGTTQTWSITSTSGGTVGGAGPSGTFAFNNIQNVSATLGSALDISSSANSVSITDYTIGLLNNPINFSGFRTITGQSGTSVVFNTGNSVTLSEVNSSTVQASFTNGNMLFMNIPIGNFSGSITPPPAPVVPVPTTNTVVNAITPVSTTSLENQSNTNATASNTAQQSSDTSTSSEDAAPVLPEAVTTVSSIDTVSQQASSQDQTTSTLNVNLNCY